MAPSHQFQQSIYIEAPLAVVDQTITNQELMQRWLNPALKCESDGPWSSELGSKTRFSIQIPLVQPTLDSTVAERKTGLVVWQFDGFFTGFDRWECFREITGTRLVNRFEFTIANPLISFGFWTFAATWTQKDMFSQLERLKKVAESL
ncbi:MAG: SRPBCC family protein [Cyanobacteria bacterium P01_A01_bin.17]